MGQITEPLRWGYSLKKKLQGTISKCPLRNYTVRNLIGIAPNDFFFFLQWPRCQGQKNMM